MSGSIPVNIGAGNIMNSCFAASWTTLAAVGVSSIAAPAPAWPNSNENDRLAFHVCPNWGSERPARGQKSSRAAPGKIWRAE
jgi:hypothetical protein